MLMRNVESSLLKMRMAPFPPGDHETGGGNALGKHCPLPLSKNEISFAQFTNAALRRIANQLKIPFNEITKKREAGPGGPDGFIRHRAGSDSPSRNHSKIEIRRLENGDECIV